MSQSNIYKSRYKSTEITSMHILHNSTTGTKISNKLIEVRKWTFILQSRKRHCCHNQLIVGAIYRHLFTLCSHALSFHNK